MKEDLTEIILDYRDAMRQLWNNHARHYDFVHRFGAVEDEYFESAVMYTAENRITVSRNRQFGFYDSIEVIPNYASFQMIVFLGVKNDNNSFSFSRFDHKEIHDIVIKYIDFFDFNVQGPREYKYVKGYISGSRDSRINIGDIVLLPADDCKYINVKNA